jgi:hypothetical protein
MELLIYGMSHLNPGRGNGDGGVDANVQNPANQYCHNEPSNKPAASVMHIFCHLLAYIKI